MKIKHITLIISENCNLDCNYCYQKSKKNGNMSFKTADNSISLLDMCSCDDLHICFSGGEPLINFELIKYIIESINKKNLRSRINFSLISNGTLITDSILSFLDNNNFAVQLSILTGNQSEEYDKIGKNNNEKIIKTIAESDNIQLSTNTVFSPDNVSELFNTTELIKKYNISDIGISFDLTTYWQKDSIDQIKLQIELLRKKSEFELSEKGKISINLFNLEKSDSIRGCGAGSGQISITPDGDIWGCDCFYFYFNNKSDLTEKTKYLYGNLNSDNFTDIFDNYHNNNSFYQNFTSDKFITERIPCFLCPDLKECQVCPAVYYKNRGNNNMLLVPDHVCKINKIILNQSRIIRDHIRTAH